MKRAPIAVLAALVVASALAALPAAAAPGGVPRIHELEYYEDLEDGRRHNLAATIRGKADEVTARFEGMRTEGRLSRHISPGGRGKSWFFRERSFVRAVLDELRADGTAKLRLRAEGPAGATRKRCTLEFEPDPMFGDYAGGDCKRIGR